MQANERTTHTRTQAGEQVSSGDRLTSVFFSCALSMMIEESRDVGCCRAIYSTAASQVIDSRSRHE